MILYFDIGNSRCKYAIESSGILSTIKYQAVEKVTQPWLASLFDGVTACFIADVANSEVSDAIALWCKNNTISLQFIKSEGQRYGVKCAYDLPESFGVDRWLTLIAAKKLFPTNNCLIIDSGTATTIDYIDIKGQHHGGWILAGIDILFTSLLANTTKVHAQPSLVKQLSFADNTSFAVNQAAWAASAGIVEQAYQLVVEQYHVNLENLTIVLTGGNAKELHRHIHRECKLIEDLIFIGMQSYK